MGTDGGVLVLAALVAVVQALGAPYWVVRIAVRDGLADARRDAGGGVPETSEGSGS